MTKSVDDGRRLYRKVNGKQTRNDREQERQADLTAKRGTIAAGRVMHRASRGDEDARARLAHWAKGGDELAQEILNGRLDPNGVTAGGPSEQPFDINQGGQQS